MTQNETMKGKRKMKKEFIEDLLTTLITLLFGLSPLITLAYLLIHGY